jgi:hypothetical protein
MIGALESAVVVGGLTAVAAGLVSQGISKEHALKYEAEIKADKFALIVNGTTEDSNGHERFSWARRRSASKRTMWRPDKDAHLAEFPEHG